MGTRQARLLRHPKEAALVQRAVEGDSDAANQFLKYLGSPYPGLRAVMLATLRDMSDPMLWKRLLHCLATQRWADRTDCERRSDPKASEAIDLSIVEVLTEDESEVERLEKELVLVEGLGDSDRRVRQAAACLLGLRGDARAVNTIAQTIQDGEGRWPLLAVRACSNLGEVRCASSLVQAMAGPDERLATEAHKALLRIGHQAETWLLEALPHPSSKVRKQIIRVLGEVATSRGKALLAERLRDEDYEVRWVAAEVLGSIGREAVPVILNLLARSELTPNLRQSALHALRTIQSRHVARHVKPLLEALQGPAPHVEAPKVAQRLLGEWSKSYAQ